MSNDQRLVQQEAAGGEQFGDDALNKRENGVIAEEPDVARARP
jgi:hypothetical protein